MYKIHLHTFNTRIHITTTITQTAVIHKIIEKWTVIAWKINTNRGTNDKTFQQNCTANIQKHLGRLRTYYNDKPSRQTENQLTVLCQLTILCQQHITQWFTVWLESKI